MRPRVHDRPRAMVSLSRWPESPRGFRCVLMDLRALVPEAEWIPFGDHPLKLERYRED